MRCPDTRSSSVMLKALLLVCLVVFFDFSPADADTASPPRAPHYSPSGDGYLHMGFQPVSPDRSPLNLDRESAETYGANPYGFEESRSRADLYTLAKLAVDELEFLAGIRIIWDKTEKKFDRLALKLKLKGDISLDSEDRSSGGRNARSDVAAIHTFTTRSAPSQPSLSLRSIFIPKKIKWNFGLDPNDHVVFGELKWGSFIALQSDIGSHQEVKLVFQHPF